MIASNPVDRVVMRPCPWCKSTDLKVLVGGVKLTGEKSLGLHGHRSTIVCNGCGSEMTQQSKIKLSKDWTRSSDLSVQATKEDWNNREVFFSA